MAELTQGAFFAPPVQYRVRPDPIQNRVKDMKELVMKQKSDVERAFLGLPGPYKVKPQFSGRVVPFTDFVKKHLQKSKN